LAGASDPQAVDPDSGRPGRLDDRVDARNLAVGEEHDIAAFPVEHLPRGPDGRGQLGPSPGIDSRQEGGRLLAMLHVRLDKTISKNLGRIVEGDDSKAVRGAEGGQAGLQGFARLGDGSPIHRP
jgi:hypothetical protein